MTTSRLGFQLGTLAATILATVLLSAPSARAAGCVNDVDCPNAACGGDVCDYNMGLTCQPAGKAAKGADGWCTVDTDCKCKGLGATCAYPYCTFTTVAQSPGGGSGGSAAVGTGGAGSGGSTAATGGKSGTGGAIGTGGASTTSDAGTAAASSSSGGGCSVARDRDPVMVDALLAMVLAAGVGLARTRRRG